MASRKMCSFLKASDQFPFFDFRRVVERVQHILRAVNHMEVGGVLRELGLV